MRVQAYSCKGHHYDVIYLFTAFCSCFNFVRVNWNSLKAEMTDKKKNPAEEKIIKPLR